MQATNLETRKTTWIARQRAPETSGILATAGGLIFSGLIDRWFSARNDSTGAELWRVRWNDVPGSAPISFAVNGKQYIAKFKILLARRYAVGVRTPLATLLLKPSFAVHGEGLREMTHHRA